MGRTRLWGWKLLSVALAFAPGVAVGQEAQRPPYMPIASDYGYMQENDALAKAANTADRAVVRNHAWNLWAGVMQPLDPGDRNSWPLWFSWQTTHQAFAPDGTAPAPAAVLPRRKPAPATHPELAATKPDLGADVSVNTPQPQYPVPDYVIKTFPGGVTQGSKGSYSVNDGDYFVNNGDIMIAVESLSQAAFDDIRGRKLYLKSTLETALAEGQRMIELPREYVSTKLMYWPVHKDGLTPLPVWTENFPDFYSGYAGYEIWNSVVAIDPGGRDGGSEVEVEYLYGLKTPEGIDIPPQRRRANVVSIDRFYHHQVTEEDWKMFSEADKAILNAASLWLTDKPFGVGDYLVTVAAHVNTKEIDSWTLQSVWWSPTPDEGPYAQDRPNLPQAAGPWDHYLLTEAYAYEPDGKGDLPKAVNPYIEGVTHPIATSCRNCHVRGGIGKEAGDAGYQTKACYGLLTALTPDSSCFTNALLTDYTWIIPDRAQ